MGDFHANHHYSDPVRVTASGGQHSHNCLGDTDLNTNGGSENMVKNYQIKFYIVSKLIRTTL